MRTESTAVSVSEANVRVRTHKVKTLRRVEARYDSLSKRGKRAVASYVPPAEDVRERNTTVEQLHTAISELLDPNTTASHEAGHLAVGAGKSTPSSGDSALSNEVYRTSVTDTSVNGTDLFTSTFLDASEANGNDLEEIALCRSGTDGASDIHNHSLISTVSKDSTNTATIDVTLTFSAT